jgi:putative Mn2+ efflux pump MntP
MASCFVGLWILCMIITVSTFIFSLLGAFMGMKAYFFKPKIALKLGGIILFSIGLKIFLEHIMA